MTQIILYQSQQGILLATDSHAITYSSQGEPQSIVVQKLFHLNSQAILVTGGAGYGLPLCERFQAYVTHKGLSDLEEVMYYALPFFSSEMQKIRQEKGFILPQPDLDRVYFLIAGHAPQDPENPFRSVLLGSEHSTDPLHTIPTGNVLAIPRQLSIEYRLTHLPDPEASLEEVESVCEQLLVKMSGKSQDVGPPFHFVQVLRGSIRVRTLNSHNS